MTYQQRILETKRQQAVGRTAGRPLENPFRSEAVERDFLQRATRVVDTYFDHSPENTKKQFVLPSCRMGKTAFWALIYYYYTHTLTPTIQRICNILPDEERPLANYNLQYFLSTLANTIGENHVGDRTLINRQYNSIKNMPISTTIDITSTAAYSRDVEKYRFLYTQVLTVWNETTKQ